MSALRKLISSSGKRVPEVRILKVCMNGFVLGSSPQGSM